MLDISMQSLAAQLLVGLINGCFYAMLSMGLAIIFGLLNIINFAHGAQFMVAAFLAWMGFTQLPLLLGPAYQINFWAALIVAPISSSAPWACCWRRRCSSACTTSITCTACC